MVHGLKSVSITISKQLLVCIIVLQFLIGTTFGISDDEIELLEGIIDPNEVPFFENFTTPTIQPGTTDKVTFELENRYKFNDDNNMSDVTLKIEIYRFVTLETSKNVKDLDQTPKIIGGNANLLNRPDQWTAVYHWDMIHKKDVIPIEISIESYSGSPQGTYFVRMHLNFSFNNTYFDMKSRGHFTETQWNRATENITDQDGVETDGKGNITNVFAGRLNLLLLGVDGLITDTSFRVKEPIPIWPLFVLIGLAMLCLLLAVIFFYMDERGKFPKLKKRIDRYSEKIRKFRYREK